MTIVDKILKLIQDVEKKSSKQIDGCNNQSSLNQQSIDEATHSTVGKYTARRDQPHFQGDEYHAHVTIPGGEASWRESGSRRHPNKFPSKIPHAAKEAAAKVLEVDVETLQ